MPARLERVRDTIPIPSPLLKLWISYDDNGLPKGWDSKTVVGGKKTEFHHFSKSVRTGCYRQSCGLLWSNTKVADLFADDAIILADSLNVVMAFQALYLQVTWAKTYLQVFESLLEESTTCSCVQRE